MAKGISIRSVRTQTYAFSKFLGDVGAITSGRSGAIAGRVTRRIAGKQTGKGLRIFN